MYFQAQTWVWNWTTGSIDMERNMHMCMNANDKNNNNNPIYQYITLQPSCFMHFTDTVTFITNTSLYMYETMYVKDLDMGIYLNNIIVVCM